MAAPILTGNLDQIVTGIMPGVNDEHVPFWIEASDVIMEASGIRPSPGLIRPYVDNGYFDDQSGQFDAYSGLFDDAGTRVYLDTISTDVLKGIHVQKQSDGRLLVVWGTNTGLYTFNGLSVVDATRNSGPYSGTSALSDIVDTTQWSFAQWGDWVLATNGADKPQVLKYGTSTEFEDLANFPADNAQIVRVLGPHALFFNLTGTYTPTGGPTGLNQFVFCKQDDVETWNPALPGASTAGELTMREHPGPVLAVEHLGNELVAYGESGTTIIQYGGQFLFTAQRGALGIRAVGKNSIASIGPQHFSLTQNGIYACDGRSFRQVAYPALGAWLEKNVDWAQRSRVAHVVDVRRSQIKWCLPGIEDDIVLVYNWLTDKIVRERRPFSAGTRVESLWRPLVGLYDGSIKMMIDDPTDRLPLLITKPLMLGNRTLHSFLDAVVLRLQGASVDVAIRYAETQDEIYNADWISLGTASQRENLLWAMRESMFVQLRLTSAANEWVLSGVEFLGKQGGGRL